MALEDKIREFSELVASVDDAQERMALVVDAARGRPALPAELCTEASRIPGCVSRAYLAADVEGGLIRFRCAADSPLVLGLLSALCDCFSGTTPAEVAASEADPLAALGLTRHLTPTRQAGLAAARRRIRELATKAA